MKHVTSRYTPRQVQYVIGGQRKAADDLDGVLLWCSPRVSRIKLLDTTFDAKIRRSMRGSNLSPVQEEKYDYCESIYGIKHDVSRDAVQKLGRIDCGFASNTSIF